MFGQEGLDDLDLFLKGQTIGELVKKLENKQPDEILHKLSALFKHIPLASIDLSRLKDVLELFDYNTDDFDQIAKDILKRRELHELELGVIDLLPSERSYWNIQHLNNKNFAPDTFIFNLSAVTDVSTFTQSSSGSPLISPTINDDGQLDWKNFSIDALFLYFSSIDGFRLAPGGLYDTQVELGNTKVPLLDNRPYTATLTDDELKTMWQSTTINNILKTNQINSYEQFIKTPRNQLILAGNTNNIHPVDLGEIRGHHWSLLIQAFRPPANISEQHHQWNFPRKAYMRALLQTLALYNLVNLSDKGVK